MRNSIAALLALCLASCAQVGIDKTYVATGDHDPKYIYIRPFEIEPAIFDGSQPGAEGELAIRKSLAPADFARILKVEMAKLAPSMVIEDDQVPEHGWLITGEFIKVDGGSRTGRFFSLNSTLGASQIKLHVTVTNVAKKQVVYAFDVDGGSNATGMIGDLGAAGLGQATQFDFHNAAETIYIALTTDPFNYGVRTAPLRMY